MFDLPIARREGGVAGTSRRANRRKSADDSQSTARAVVDAIATLSLSVKAAQSNRGA